jgi:hypothetical protein
MGGEKRIKQEKERKAREKAEIGIGK